LIVYLDIPLELFLDEEDEKENRKLDDIPPKLAKFSDILDTSKVVILPLFKNTDHRISLVPGTTLPIGPLYPLS
jgi:hypothetical protein